MEIFGVKLSIGKKKLSPGERALEDAIEEKDKLFDAQRRVAGMVPGAAVIVEQKDMENRRQTLRLHEEIRDMKDSAAKKVARIGRQIGELYSLQILSPNPGEIWRMGESWTIRWTSTGLVADKLALEFHQGGKFSRHIAMVSSEAGYYTWSIPKKPKNADAIFPPGGHCQIVIVDPGLPHIYGKSKEFWLIARPQQQNQPNRPQQQNQPFRNQSNQRR